MARGIRSAGRNLDLFTDDPQRILAAWRISLETARIDPYLSDVDRRLRIEHHEEKIKEWEATCNLI